MTFSVHGSEIHLAWLTPLRRLAVSDFKASSVLGPTNKMRSENKDRRQSGGPLCIIKSVSITNPSALFQNTRHGNDYAMIRDFSLEAKPFLGSLC